MHRCYRRSFQNFQARNHFAFVRFCRHLPPHRFERRRSVPVPPSFRPRSPVRVPPSFPASPSSRPRSPVVPSAFPRPRSPVVAPSRVLVLICLRPFGFVSCLLFRLSVACRLFCLSVAFFRLLSIFFRLNFFKIIRSISYRIR